MTTVRQNMYVLLVGINEYANPRIPRLGGCVNDVDAMEQLLRDRFNVPPENIIKLTNQQATYQAIKDTFRTHLIAQAQIWANAGKPEPTPAFLFHYSGHGSQAPDATGQEPDGLDETIVPHDSRVNDVYDLKDWELGQLIDELTAPFSEKNVNVTIILDCCHSGSGTRDMLPVRRCEPDLRPQPTQRPIRAATTRGVIASSGWELGGKYVLLAGCRDQESANEYVAPQSQTGRCQYGAMSYFLLQELATMSPNRPLSYRELHERLRYQVNSRYAAQMPQCEGQKDRQVFGGRLPAREIFLSVIDKKDGLIWVDGGVAHGLTEGSQLHLYPPESTSLKGTEKPLAILYTQEVGAVKSGCLIEQGPADVPLFSRAVVAYLGHSPMQRRIKLDIPADKADLLAEVQNLLTEELVKPYIKLVSGDQPADLRLRLVGENLEIQDNTGRLLVAPFPPDKRYELPDDLIHLARYYNTLNLRNTACDSGLAGSIAVKIKRLGFVDNQPTSAPIEPNAEGEIELAAGERIVVEVTNRSRQDLYVAVFNFAHDWSVNLLYPRMEGAHEVLKAGRRLQLGLSNKREEQLSPGLLAGINEAGEFIKVIAAVEETHFEMLHMGPLKTTIQPRDLTLTGERSALTALLEQAAAGSSARSIGAPPPTVVDEWTTAELQFHLVRSQTDKNVTRNLRGGEITSLPGYNLEVEPPPGFVGQARVLTARQQARAASGDQTELAPPPGLAAAGRWFTPLEIPAKGVREAMAPGGMVIEIEGNNEARQTVTAATPLKLRLPGEFAAEPMLALAYDGNLFYPVGRSGDEANTLDVEWLPEVIPPEEEALRTRNLGRTVKLYLFKMIGRSEPSLGLHLVRFVPAAEIIVDSPAEDELSYEVVGGDVRYRNLRPGDLTSGQRVALFTHGFTSETCWMVGGIIPWLAANGLVYDRYLAFDYETFSTRIGDNGQALARALRAAGFSSNDGLSLDVFAHGMGALVVRSMVEQHGGEIFVDRCFLAGPPNQGTRLAETKRLIPWLGTLLLNQAGPTPPTLIASWVLKKVTDDAVGGDDLRPGSEFCKLLNGSDRPAKAPYYILAGRHDLPTHYKNVWDRVVKTLVGAADAGLDMLFGDQHDMVVNLRSMLTVRNGDYPANLLHKRILGCNHFNYFVDAEGRQQLLEWLRG